MFGDTVSTTSGTITFVEDDQPYTVETEYKVLEGLLTHIYTQDPPVHSRYAYGTTGIESGVLRVNPDTRHYFGYATGEPVSGTRCGGGAPYASGDVQIGSFEIGRFKISEDLARRWKAAFTTTDCSFVRPPTSTPRHLVAFGDATPAPPCAPSTVAALVGRAHGPGHPLSLDGPGS